MLIFLPDVRATVQSFLTGSQRTMESETTGDQVHYTCCPHGQGQTPTLLTSFYHVVFDEFRFGGEEITFKFCEPVCDVVADAMDVGLCLWWCELSICLVVGKVVL